MSDSAASCERCNGTGELTNWESVSRFPCPSCASGRRKAFAQAGIPRRFQELTLDSFPGELPEPLREPSWFDDDEWPEDAKLPWLYDDAPERKPGILLHGEPSRGKTGLAVGIFRHMILAPGYTHWTAAETAPHWIAGPDWLEEIRQAFSTRGNAAQAIFDRAAEACLLIIDDLGTERMNEFAEERLYRLVNTRHGECAPTIVTTNLSPVALMDALGKRITERLIELCEVIKIDGPNLRH